MQGGIEIRNSQQSKWYYNNNIITIIKSPKSSDDVFTPQRYQTKIRVLKNIYELPRALVPQHTHPLPKPADPRLNLHITWPKSEGKTPSEHLPPLKGQSIDLSNSIAGCHTIRWGPTVGPLEVTKAPTAAWQLPAAALLGCQNAKPNAKWLISSALSTFCFRLFFGAIKFHSCLVKPQKKNIYAST